MAWTVPLEPELRIGHGPQVGVQGSNTVDNPLIVDVLKQRQIGQACRPDLELRDWCGRGIRKRARHTSGGGGSNPLELYRLLHAGWDCVARHEAKAMAGKKRLCRGRQ